MARLPGDRLKIIQISTVPAVRTSDDSEYEPSRIVALCDDGSLWHYDISGEGGWAQIMGGPA